MDQCKTSKDYVEGTEKYKAYANDVATSSTQTGFQIDAFRSAPPHNDTNLLYIFILKSLAKKLKKEAFKCPWEDCNFLRHDWSNHTVKVYHYLWVIPYDPDSYAVPITVPFIGLSPKQIFNLECRSRFCWIVRDIEKY